MRKGNHKSQIRVKELGIEKEREVISTLFFRPLEILRFMTNCNTEYKATMLEKFQIEKKVALNLARQMRRGGLIKLKKKLEVNPGDELGPYLGHTFRKLVLRESLSNYKPKNPKFNRIYKIKYFNMEISEIIRIILKFLPYLLNKKELLLLDIEDKLRKEGYI